MKVELVTSTPDHIRELYKTLREEDRKEVIRLGFEPDRALFHSCKHALIRRTGLIDGRVAGMWGVVGSPLGIVGQPYLMTSKYVSEISPLRFASIYKQEAAAFSQIFPVLENYVDAEYDKAIRLLEIVGFSVDRQNPFKTKNGDMFYKFRKEL